MYRFLPVRRRVTNDSAMTVSRMCVQYSTAPKDERAKKVVIRCTPAHGALGELTRSAGVCLALCGRGMRRALRSKGGLCACVPCLHAGSLEPVPSGARWLAPAPLPPRARWGLGREDERPGVRAGARGGGRVVHKKLKLKTLC